MNKFFMFTFCLFASVLLSVYSIDIDDDFEDFEDARDLEMSEDYHDDDDAIITLGELKELEEKVRNDPVPGRRRRRRRRRRRSWRGRRFINRVKPWVPYIPIAVKAVGDDVEKK